MGVSNNKFQQKFKKFQKNFKNVLTIHKKCCNINKRCAIQAYGLLAQVVEHLTFNQVVPRSSRG